MRFPQFLVVIAVAGLSVLATTYALRSGNSDKAPAASVHEQALQQEIERLRKTNDNLTTDLNRLHTNRNQPPAAAPPAGHAASPKPGMTPTAAAPPPAPHLVTLGESPPTDDEPPRAPIIINHPTQAQMDAVKLTPEQGAFFENMKQRLDNPAFVSTMNMSELTKMEEMKALPDPLRQALLAKAIEKYNRGEVDEKTFLSGMAGYSQ